MDLPETQQQDYEPPVPLKKGWLKKAPPLGQFNGFKNWNKRYFVLLQLKPNSQILLNKMPKKGAKQMQKLQNYYLVYWESEDTKKRPLRAIPLLGSYQVRMFPTYEKVKNMISLITNERIFFVLAPSAEEMQSWYNHLSNVIGSLDVEGESNASPCTDVATQPLPDDHGGEPVDYNSIYSNITKMKNDGDTLVDWEHYSKPESVLSTDIDEVPAVQDSASSMNSPYGVYKGPVSSLPHLHRSYTDNVSMRSKESNLATTSSGSKQRPFSVPVCRSVGEKPETEEIYERIDESVAENEEKNEVGARYSSNYKLNISGELLTLSLTSADSTSSSVSGIDPAVGRLLISHGCYEVTLKKK